MEETTDLDLDDMLKDYFNEIEINEPEIRKVVKEKQKEIHENVTFVKLLPNPDEELPTIQAKQKVHVFVFDETGKILANSIEEKELFRYDLKTPPQNNQDYIKRSRKCLKCGSIAEAGVFLQCYCKSTYHIKCNCGCENHVSHNTLTKHEKTKKRKFE
eukprot:gene2003-1510_t